MPIYFPSPNSAIVPGIPAPNYYNASPSNNQGNEKTQDKNIYNPKQNPPLPNNNNVNYNAPPQNYNQFAPAPYTAPPNNQNYQQFQNYNNYPPPPPQNNNNLNYAPPVNNVNYAPAPQMQMGGYNNINPVNPL